MTKPKAAIIGISEQVLKKEEKSLVSKKCPFGIILFSRNISSFEQVKKLTLSLRDAASWDIPIFIDQEGGKVQRLSGSDWLSFPPINIFGKIAKKSLKSAIEGTYLNHQLIADDLTALGINVNCSPCLDIYSKSASEIIGNRSFSDDPNIVHILGKTACEAMLSRGVIPVIKHLPGHGRANADSHKKLPEVKEDLYTLEQSDFIPFKKLNNNLFGMTAHILFKSIDPVLPISISAKALNYIRNNLFFEGILLSDDIEMSALSGSLNVRAQNIIKAGCDVVLYCGGNNLKNEKLLDTVPLINVNAWQKWLKGSSQVTQFFEPFDRDASRSRLKHLLGNYY